ncbi:hypothetical protein N7539_003249 [Penicillium diatomitis]|uniref:N-acetyltransferase domain-containing protein n=1 Tax=Penicillium diatomitis TaxID=2819901 RepID=A0A9X0BZY5_9EURO|nr:uncharacterized protein N7539_003249 [Penicillium diatomitis]KAJ5491682.1 hypothetical protein N7539_003249 [Penicillium diatomitis]
MQSKRTGPDLQGHTDITQVDLGLDFSRRNNIAPANVVFGLTFCGCSFTMRDLNCHQPNGQCEFSDGGKPGSCSETTLILTYAEINPRSDSCNVYKLCDSETAIIYNIYGGTQWISYDGEKSFLSRIIWATDQGTGKFDAFAGLLGENLLPRQMKCGIDVDAANVLADVFAAFTECETVSKHLTARMDLLNTRIKEETSHQMETVERDGTAISVVPRMPCPKIASGRELQSAAPLVARLSTPRVEGNASQKLAAAFLIRRLCSRTASGLDAEELFFHKLTANVRQTLTIKPSAGTNCIGSLGVQTHSKAPSAVRLAGALALVHGQTAYSRPTYLKSTNHTFTSSSASQDRVQPGRSRIPAYQILAFIGHEAGGIAGGILADEPGVAEVVSVWVAPSTRCRAVGDALIITVEEWAVEADVTQLKLDVALDNVQDVKLHLRHGFFVVPDQNEHEGRRKARI